MAPGGGAREDSRDDAATGNAVFFFNIYWEARFDLPRSETSPFHERWAGTVSPG